MADLTADDDASDPSPRLTLGTGPIANHPRQLYGRGG
jgi:hypothetical protein